MPLHQHNFSPNPISWIICEWLFDFKNICSSTGERQMFKSLLKSKKGSTAQSNFLSPGREQVPLEIFLVTWNNPYAFVKGNLFFINPIYFYDEFPRSVDMMESASFAFSRALNLICHGVFVGELWSRWMDYQVSKNLDEWSCSKGSDS